VYDVGQVDGVHYMVMAYIKGRALSAYIDPQKPIPPRRVAAVVRKLALALEAAHRQGVVHRDLKPSNIMVNSRRELVIMDFGLAWRLGRNEERLTKHGLVLGTPAYMSPEQLSGNVESLGPRCDIYSLGVIMYELLTACYPFEGSEAVILGQILFVEPVPPSRHRPDLDPRIEAICLKAMAKRPEDRFPTMSDLAAVLGDYIRGESLPARPSCTALAPGVPGASIAAAPQTGEPGTIVASPEPGGLERCEPEPEPDRTEVGSRSEAEPATWWKSWCRWTAIVDRVTLGQSLRRVEAQAYRKLYNELIEAFRSRAAVSDEPNRACYRKLENLVLPWLTPKTLENADREILFSLLWCCREAEHELGLPPSAPAPRRGWPWTHPTSVWAAALFLAVMVVSGLIVWMWIVS
jgi:hypothetical protein